MQTEDFQLPTANWTDDDSPSNRQSAIGNWKSFLAHPAFVITLLTIVAGILRFSFMSRPPLWGDEAATYMRVCGTFQELRGELQIAGFGPLHYLLYWWIRQITPLWPWVMRLPPAIAGTLMVPAIYFLALQLVPRRTALLVAALTTFSAYMLNYSHDAKMYAELWLFVTLNVGCMLCWLRTRKAIAWWGWLTSGVIMAGLHAVSFFLLPIELLILLTSRNLHWKSLGVLILSILWLPFIPLLFVLRLARVKWISERIAIGRWLQQQFRGFHWPPLFFFILGCAIILIGPFIYYTQFNQFNRRLFPESPGMWMNSGLGWVEEYNAGRGAVDLLRFTGSAFLDNWEWPRPEDQSQISPLNLKLLKAATIALFAELLLGILPWRWIGNDDEDLTQMIGPTLRGSLWLCLWIALPLYGCYCLSVHGAAWPMDWLTTIFLKQPPQIEWMNLASIGSHSAAWREFFHNWADGFSQIAHAFTLQNLRWQLLVFLIVLFAAWIAIWPYDWRNRLRRIGIVCQIVLLVLICCLLVRLAIAEPMPGSLWMPRYLGIIWPALAIVLAVLYMRLPTKPLRWSAVGLFIIVNVTMHGMRLFATSEPPTDVMARDVIDSQPPNNTSRIYYRVRQRGLGQPATGTLKSQPGGYYLALYSGRTVTPDEIYEMDYDKNFEVWSGISFFPLDPYVASSLQSAPQINRVFVWDELAADQEPIDTLGKMLGPQWKLTHQNIYQARDHWIWSNMYIVRRRVYERQ
jgi:hypothetical protein